MIIDAGCIWLSSTDLLGPPCCDPEPAGAAARLGSEVHALIHCVIRGRPLPPASPEALEQLALWQRDYVMPPDERIICSESDTAPAAVRVYRTYPGDTEPRANVRVGLREKCVTCACVQIGHGQVLAYCPDCLGAGLLDIGIQSSGDLTYHSECWRGIQGDDWKDGRNQDEDRWLKQSGIEALLAHACAPGYEWYEATAVWIRYHCTRWSHRYSAAEIPSLREWWADRAAEWLSEKKLDTRKPFPYCAPDKDGEGGCARRLTCPAYQALFLPFNAETLRAENMLEADALEDRLSAIGRAVEAGKARLKKWKLARTALCPVESGWFYWEDVIEVPEAKEPRKAYTMRKLKKRPATVDEISRYASPIPVVLQVEGETFTGEIPREGPIAPRPAIGTGDGDDCARAEGAPASSPHPEQGQPSTGPAPEASDPAGTSAVPLAGEAIPLPAGTAPIQPSDPAAIPFAEPEKKRAPRRKPMKCPRCTGFSRPVPGHPELWRCLDCGEFDPTVPILKDPKEDEIPF